jgi:hypothetical protein
MALLTSVRSGTPRSRSNRRNHFGRRRCAAEHSQGFADVAADIAFRQQPAYKSGSDLRQPDWRTRHRLRKDPGSSALSLNRFGVGIVLDVYGATPITCGRTTRVLECAAHRARLRDVHTPVTGSVIGRRVLGHHPGHHPRRDESNNYTHPDQQDPAVPRRERISWRSLASVDRRRLLPSANSIECTITTLPSRCAVLGCDVERPRVRQLTPNRTGSDFSRSEISPKRH